MGKIISFNREEIITSDLDFLQDTKSEEISNRLKDQILTHGILPPATSTPIDISQGCIGAFTLLSPSSNVINIGPAGAVSTNSIHVAYDDDNNRVAFPDGDVVSFNKNSYKFTTTGISAGIDGVGTTPFSTGRLSVDTRAPSSGSATRYVFIAYMPVVKTISCLTGTPPNHNVAPTGVTVNPTLSTNKAIGSIDQLTGLVHTQQSIDGYRIFVAIGPDDPDVIATTKLTEVSLASTTPILIQANILNNAYISAFDNYDKAIYLGKFTVISAGTVSGIDHANRKLLSLRPIESALISAANKPTSYSVNQTKSVLEHISAVAGDGSKVTPDNPHGTTYAILGPLPLAATHTIKNVIDYSEAYRVRSHPSNNPPIDSEGEAGIGVAHSWIYNSGSLVTPTTYSTATISGGASPVIASTVGPTGFYNAVWISPLQANQAIIIGGTEYSATGVAPQTGYPVSPNTVTPFVPFVSGDAQGEWTIFATTINGQVLLGKVQESVNTLPTSCLSLAKVNHNWSGVSRWISPSLSDIRLDASGISATEKLSATDLRSLGSIGIEQVSTEAISHPTKSLFAQQDFNNCVGNPDGSYGIIDWIPNSTGGFIYTFDPTTNISTLATGTNGTISVSAITSSTVPALNLSTTGPKKDSAIKVALAPTSSGINKSIGIGISSIKPDTTYNVAVWIAASGIAGANDIRITAKFVNNTGQTNYTVTTKGTNVEWPTDIVFTRDGLFHKAVVTLKTNSSPLVTASTNRLAIDFYKLTGMTGNCDVFITDLMVTEGEWTHANIKSIPSSTQVVSLVGGGGNCPGTIYASDYTVQCSNSIRYKLFEFGGGELPSIVSRGQLCTITCSIPYMLYKYRQNGTNHPLYVQMGLVAALYVDDIIKDHGEQLETDNDGRHGTYSPRGMLYMQYTGYLAAGPHMIRCDVMGINLSETNYLGSLNDTRRILLRTSDEIFSHGEPIMAVTLL